MTKYKRGHHPASRANLGKQKTKAGRKCFSLTKQSLDWLAAQKNASQAVDEMIEKKIMEEKVDVIAKLIESLEVSTDYDPGLGLIVKAADNGIVSIFNGFYRVYVAGLAAIQALERVSKGESLEETLELVWEALDKAGGKTYLVLFCAEQGG